MPQHSGFEKLVADAKKNVTEISPEEAAKKLQNHEAVIVDVREKDEWAEAAERRTHRFGSSELIGPSRMSAAIYHLPSVVWPRLPTRVRQ
jgi:hypothetical protein